MVITNCQQCGEAFEMYPSRMKSGRGLFCGKPCYHKALSKRMAGEKHPLYGKKHSKASIAKMRRSAKQRGATIRGANNPRFRGFWVSKGYRILNVNGLEGRQKELATLMLPKNHGGVAEHRLVVAAREDRPLRSDEIVHHLNGVKTDNRPENLALMDHSDHKKDYQALLKELRRLRLENERLRSLLPTSLASG